MAWHRGSWLALVWMAFVLEACAGPAATPRSPAATTVAVGSGEARRWGNGEYGVVLLGATDVAWDAFAQRMAADRMTVLAPSTADAGALRNSLAVLLDEDGLERAAVVAVGESAAQAAFAVGSSEPERVDQLIALGATDGDLAAVGPFPKLLIVTQADTPAAERLAASAAGEWNNVASMAGDPLVPGDALAELVLDRLAERR